MEDFYDLETGNELVGLSPELDTVTKIFQLLPRYLNRNDVLNLRLISRPWSQMVDDYIGEASQYVSLSMKDHGPRVTRSPVWNQGDWNFPYMIGGQRSNRWEMNVEAFIKSMRNHPRNPFVGKGLSVIANGQGVDENLELPNKAKKLLSVFGHHLKYLNLELCQLKRDPNEHEEQSELIKIILGHTRNLKQLRITANFEVRSESFGMKSVQLPGLRTLQLGDRPIGSTPKRHTLAHELIRIHSGQLERFEVEGIEAPKWDKWNWQNLEELKVAVFDKGYISGLCRLEAPQLTKLTLEYCRRAHHMGELMEVLRNFPKMKPKGMRIYGGGV